VGSTPFSLFLALVTIPVGLTAAILGSSVSRAITNVLQGELIPHAWGIVLLVAGVTTLRGIGKDSWLSEYVGLQLMAIGLFFYSGCCYLGLGLGGVVSGSLAFAYAAGCWYRARALFKLAKASAEAKRNAISSGERSDR
jgi:hypothetical protein